jgi:Tol biopolymer transport system component
MVAYSSTESGSAEIIVMKVNGRKIRITDENWHNFSPVWSPDDTELAYASVRGSQTGIYICPSLGGVSKPVKIIEKGDVLLLSWSKDGMIFYESEGNLFSLEIAGSAATQITNFPPDEASYFSISPDKRSIAYRKTTDGQMDLWVKPIGEGEPFRITNDKDKERKNRWHADGKRIIYSVRRDDTYQISVVSIDGGEPIHLTRGDGKYELVDVSPDGTKIFYKKELGKFDIWKVNADSGEDSVVASGPEYEFWPKLSPDGKSIAYQTTLTQFMHLSMYRSSVVVRKQDDENARHSFPGFGEKWLPDSRRIAFFRLGSDGLKHDLWLFDTVSGNESQVTFGGAAPPGHAAFPLNISQVSNFDWSPVEDRLVYLASGRRNVLMTSPGDAEAVNLTGSKDPRTTYLCPIWSADGNRVAYVSLEMPDGQPDNARWRVWVYEGGVAKKVYETSKSLRFLGWPAGGDLLLEATDGFMKADPIDIELLRVSTNGKSSVVNSFDKISALSMALSPDGKSVAYVARSGGKEGIFTASTLKGEEKQIFSSTDPEVHLGALGWSPDGKTIFVDKQEETNVISMFQNFE